MWQFWQSSQIVQVTTNNLQVETQMSKIVPILGLRSPQCTGLVTALSACPRSEADSALCDRAAGLALVRGKF